MKKILILFLFASCLGFGFLELLLRIDGRGSQAHRWMEELAIVGDDGELRGRPGASGWHAARDWEVFVDLDENGWRAVPAIADGPEQRRVILLGGPSVWGVGVGEDELLSSWLAAELPPGSTVENRAGPSRGLDPLRRGLERAVAEVEVPTRMLVFVGAADLVPEPGARNGSLLGIEDWSFAARFLRERWMRLSSDAEAQASEGQLPAREATEAEIWRMDDAAQRAGVPLALVFAPDGRASDSLQRKARDEFAEIAAARGIPFLDLLDPLEQFDQPAHPAFSSPFATWTPQAHFQVARLLLDSDFVSGPVKDQEIAPGGRWVAPDDPLLGYSGRVDRSNPKQPRFDWAGVTLKIRMRGDSARFFLHAERQHDYFDVRVDGERSRIWIPGPAGRELRLEGLGEGVHDIEIVKRTDGIAPVLFYGVWLPPGAEILPVDPPPPLRVLVLGASWAHGYGNEGTLYGHENGGRSQRNCADSRRSTNAALSWPMVLGEILGAEVHLISKGAGGVLRNYQDTERFSVEPVPARLARRLSSEPDSRWDPGEWVPNVVVINLGENDFTEGPTPSDMEFVDAYRSLLAKLREDYPEAFIVTYNLEEDERVMRVVGEALNLRRADGDKNLAQFSYSELPRAERGCNNHPSVPAHRRMAEELAEYVRAHAGASISPSEAFSSGGDG